VTTPAPVVAAQFTVSSMRTSYGIQGQFAGTIAVHDGWMYVVAPTGALKTYQRDAQRYWDLRLRAGLVTCVPNGQWEVVSESRAVKLAPLLGITENMTEIDTLTRALRDTVRFDLGIPPGTALERSWVAFIFEWPFQNLLATYLLHTDAALAPSAQWAKREAAWKGSVPPPLGARCR
jgi:hypothetical protein